MKLARYSNHDGPAIGLMAAGGIVPLARHLPSAPTDMVTLIAQWDRYKALIAGLAGVTDCLPLSELKLLAPIARPGKILGIGLNYQDHIAESGLEAPRDQLWFSKAVTAINGPFDPIRIPRVSAQLDYEAELVVIVGKPCRYTDRHAAADAIFGFCAGNDVSVRDWQFRNSQFMLGKSFDTSAPIGPWIVTSDEIDSSNLDISCRVNGVERQNSNTRHLIFDCIAQVEYLSQVMTLEPGDLLFTGTPSGVGFGMKPQEWLKVGDTVTVDIQGIGAIENVVQGD